MRCEDWPERLAAFVESNRARPFVWGSWDCAMCAAAWIKEATGQDPFQAPYSDLLGALRYIEEQGGMGPAVAAVLGAPLLHPLGAGRGDVALVDVDGRLCLGIVLGELVAGPAETGLLMVPRAAIQAAWAV